MNSQLPTSPQVLPLTSTPLTLQCTCLWEVGGTLKKLTQSLGEHGKRHTESIQGQD